jgi:hypothetical protein
MLAALAVAASRFIVTPRAEQAPLFVVPRGIVVLLALLAAITFLTEGAISTGVRCSLPARDCWHPIKRALDIVSSLLR